MKVLLVEPPKKIWELMGGNCISPPLGLAYLAAALEKEGIAVNILDCNASGVNWSELEDFVGEARPDVVGASAMTPFFRHALGVARAAKRANPDIVTVLG
nr:B12-binding domain-containing radical SAM protein [Anaerolineae bacterium]